MNIKEIIDAERWGGSYGAATSRVHNASLDNIEAGVTDYVAELEEALDVSYNAEREALKKRIAELELELQRYKQAPKLPHISGGSCNTTHYACDCVLRRIAELEAQLPKVVTPVFNIGNFDCPECEYRTLPEPCLYCPGCGAKLDWSSND